MHNPILTIAIPTYNRPESIKSQIKALMPQLTEEVSLIVLDNFSDVPVSSILTESERERTNIIRNNYNIGADSNIAKCFELCETRWLWTLSDDDAIAQDAVSNVLNSIKQFDDALFINFNSPFDYRIKGVDAFGNSISNYQRLFWMSICLYNFEKLQPYLYYYHSSISTMQPGVVLLLYALQDIKDSYVVGKRHCIITDGGKDIHWKRADLVISTLFCLEKIKIDFPQFKGTMFHSMAAMLYSIIRQNYNNNFFYSLKLLRRVINGRGFFVTLKYDLKSVVRTVFFLIFYRSKNNS